MAEFPLAKPEEAALDKLTPRERAAYKLSVSRREPFLSATLSDQLYNLYQSGKTCEDIAALNPGLNLGMIVRARVDFRWDERRQAYLESMLDNARQRAQQLSLEALTFIGDLLTTFHRHDQAKFQKFVQTGDPNELKGALLVEHGGVKVYATIIDLLRLMTGQDNTKRVAGTVEHLHRVEAPTDQPVPQAAKPLTPEQAAAVIASLGAKDDGHGP